MQGAPAEQTRATSANNGGSQQSPSEPWREPIVIVTLALAIVGAAQVGLFWWQLSLIRESLADAKEAADAAKHGADAARQSADIAKMSLVATNRAYIQYNGCRNISHLDERFDDGRIFWRIRPSWFNAGNTPARQIRVSTKYILQDQLLPDCFDFSEDQSAPSRIPLGAKALLEVAHFDISGADLTEIKRGTKFFYAWGVIRYRDAFDETPERVTKFCVAAITVTGSPMIAYDEKTNPVEIRYANHPGFSCADEDCA